MKQIFISTTSFSQFSEEPIELLQSQGYEVGDLDILYTTDIGVNEDIIIYPMGILINDGSGGLSLGSDHFFLINAESSQSGKIYVYDFNNDGLDDAYIDDTGNDTQPFPGGQNILLIQDAAGKVGWLHEISQFEQIDGRWLYTDGTLLS